jgi:hypothetical protein
MMKLKLTILLYLTIIVGIIYPQVDFSIDTDKIEYEYGEPIAIYCTVTNNTDSTVSMLLPNSNSCQAEFEFDDYKSYLWTTCLATSEEIHLLPNKSRIYYWLFDPIKYGYPNKDGVHKLKGYFSYRLEPYIKSESILLKDSIFIEAPMFLGGQLQVSFTPENDSVLAIFKDSLKVKVLERLIFPDIYDGYNINEVWQVIGISIDSLYNNLIFDQRLRFVQYNRRISYDSINTITSISDDTEYEPKYFLSEVYPNPFNQSANINIIIPSTEYVEIYLYNMLGQKVFDIYKGLIIKIH